MTVYPQQVRSASLDVWCGRQRSTSKKCARWVLDVAGPFCVWPRDKDTYRRNSRQPGFADSTSSLLALPCNLRVSSNVIHLDVVISRDERERLIRKEYARQTSSRR